MLLHKKKPQHAATQPQQQHSASGAAHATDAHSQPGQKRKRDDAAPSKPVVPAAVATLASQLEAHSKHSHQQKKQKLAAQAAAAAAASAPARPASAASSKPVKSGPAPVRQLSALQQKMASKLAGARFRWLNEKLYTCSSSEAYEYFQSHPEEFQEYHKGFGVQVTDWPVNPLDQMIAWIKSKPSNLVVGDFGCGEARLAEEVPNKVHSFDLVAHNPRVVACNIAHTPLKDASLDVAVFCLSLMGVDFISFLREAHRTLRPSGTLLISEVKSRFAEAGIDVFVSAVKEIGFTLKRKDLSNQMFATMEFGKTGGKHAHKESDEAETEEAEETAEDDAMQTQGSKPKGSHKKHAAPQKQAGGGHLRNKQKGKAGAAGGAAGGKGAVKGATQFSHPVPKKQDRKAGAGGNSEAGPMLTACIYKKR